MIARTSLIIWYGVTPLALRMTLNVVFTSERAAAESTLDVEELWKDAEVSGAGSASNASGIESAAVAWTGGAPAAAHDGVADALEPTVLSSGMCCTMVAL